MQSYTGLIGNLHKILALVVEVESSLSRHCLFAVLCHKGPKGGHPNELFHGPASPLGRSRKAESFPNSLHHSRNFVDESRLFLSKGVSQALSGRPTFPGASK